jgi:hypothetical protein
MEVKNTRPSPAKTRDNLRRGVTAFVLLAALFIQPKVRAQSPVTWPLWESYANKFLDGQGRVIDHAVGDRPPTIPHASTSWWTGPRPT